MKKLIFTFLIICSLQIFAQIKTPSDFDFSTSFYEAENRYIVFSPKTNDTKLILGMPYVDPTAGYSYKYFGNLIVENEKLKFVPADENGSMIARWQNLDLKVAVLSDERVKEFKLANPPEFLKFYKSNKPEKDFLVDKLSFMNGAGFPKLALPKLEQLRKDSYKSEKFYFELAFAYNALEQNAKAEEVVDEAEKNNFHSELLIKEKHYSMLHQNKLIPASEYLQQNFSNFRTKNFKSESIVNQIINFSNHQDSKNAEKWIQIYKKEIGEDQYKTHVENIEKKLKESKK